MRVFALTFGGADYASSYYRVVQYQKPLVQHGIEMEVCPIKTFDWRSCLLSYDVVLLQKKLISHSKLTWLRRNSRRLIYDTDDAIWHAQQGTHHWFTTWRLRRRLRTIVIAAKLCLAANSVLASFLGQWNRRVHVLPMALDESVWTRRPDSARGQGTIRIGWAGKGVNLPYLEAIEPALLALQRKYAHVQFVVFSGDRPQFRELKCEFLPYQPGSEPESIRSFDIGLLPLAMGSFSEGKSPIKALQYMATGIPSVVSPRGATRDMFEEGQTAMLASTDEDWLRALAMLVENCELRCRIGTTAREQFEKNYALSSAVPKFANYLRAVTKAEA